MGGEGGLLDTMELCPALAKPILLVENRYVDLFLDISIT
jgi:hypothetical protein